MALITSEESIALWIVLGYNLDNGKDGKSELNAWFETGGYKR